MTRGARLFAAVFVVGLALDLWSKEVAFRAVPPPGRPDIEVIEGFFYITQVRNPGMAWSLLQGVESWAWILIRGTLSLILVRMYVVARRGPVPWWGHVAFAFLLAGALGNLYDNAFAQEGRVRDFLRFVFGGWSFPVFNVADAMITVGAPLLFLYYSWAERKAKAAAAAEGREAADGGARPVEANRRPGEGGAA
ncbi:MAG TPA: signal peptidase II [Planctomycetota bacterium]|nr:signal peptidase II [Planctomycetota bacterium]